MITSILCDYLTDECNAQILAYGSLDFRGGLTAGRRNAAS